MHQVLHAIFRKEYHLAGCMEENRTGDQRSQMTEPELIYLKASLKLTIHFFHRKLLLRMKKSYQSSKAELLHLLTVKTNKVKCTVYDDYFDIKECQTIRIQQWKTEKRHYI